jgi:hypothetical protein
VTALSTESRELLIAAFRGSSGAGYWSVYERAWSAMEGDWTEAALIVGGVGMRVYDTVPAVPKPPAIVISPDSPWIRPNRLGSNLNYEVRWKILVIISPRQNAAATLDTEAAVDSVLAMIPNGFTCQGVNAPQLQDIGAQGTILTTEINVSASMKE